jgi:hypothetical protein
MTKLTLPVYISTNDKHTECLKVFTELYKKFWKGEKFNVLGYTPLDVGELGTFHSMGEQGTVQEWSTDLRQYFEKIEDDFFIYGTEDCAFTDYADIKWINQLAKIIQKDPSVGRINLVNPCDREGYTIDNNPHYKAERVDDYGEGKLYKLTKESGYAITAQISIWRKEFFLKYCQPNLSPWDFELKGSTKWASNEDFSVLLVYNDRYPVQRVEAYAASRGWENKEAWIDSISEPLKEELKL